MAYRYRCPHRVSLACESGAGKPRKARCKACRGEFLVSEGRWGVFTWRGDNRYPAADAHASFESLARAEKAADADPNREHVVRWIPST